MSVKVDFGREREWWDSRAAGEEWDSADEAINRALRWREIERHLNGVQTILDVGAGTGAFPMPLAQRGFSVVHLDFSPATLGLARQRAGLIAVAEQADELSFGSAADRTRPPRLA